MTAAVTARGDLTVPEFDADALRSGGTRYVLVLVLVATVAGAAVAGVTFGRSVAWEARTSSIEL